MRPQFFSTVSRLFHSPAACTRHDHGLPPDTAAEYNSRRILPMQPGVDASQRPAAGAEFVMKRQAQQPETPAAPSAPGPVTTRPGESRAQRLARIRREIEAGTYETPEKLEIAISRMLGTLAD